MNNTNTQAISLENLKEVLIYRTKILLLLLFSFCFSNGQSKTEADSVAYYLNKKNAIKALNYIRTKSQECLANKDLNTYCEIMLKKAELYQQFNDTENGLKTLFEALHVAEKNNLLYYKVLLYRSIGIYNGSIFEYTKAKKYLHLGEKNLKKLNNNFLSCKIYQGFFKIHIDTESDSAYYYLKKIDYYSNLSKDLKQKAINHGNFYHYYTAKKEFLLAKQHLDSNYQINLKLNDKTAIANSKNNLGVYYMTVEKDYNKAKDEYLEILKMYPNNENTTAISNAYLNISYAYEKLNDYKKALNYTNKYLEVFEDVSSGRLSQINQEIETKYAIQKVESDYKTKEKLIEERQSKNQKILLLFAALIFFASILFYFYYQNLVLKQKNKLKDIDNELQYKIISATLDGQDQERNKISAVLHDNVSATLSSVGLHLSALQSSLNEEQIIDLKKTRSLLIQAHDKVRDLSHELVPPLLVKFGLQYALKDLCDNHTNKLLKFEYSSNFSMSKRYNQEFETKIFYIISELFNNIIKHSNATVASLNFTEKNNKLIISISDNGKGFDVKNAIQSNGFGITQIKARIKNMNGKINISSEINEGTAIIISVDV